MVACTWNFDSPKSFVFAAMEVINGDLVLGKGLLIFIMRGTLTHLSNSFCGCGINGQKVGCLGRAT